MDMILKCSSCHVYFLTIIILLVGYINYNEAVDLGKLHSSVKKIEKKNRLFSTEIAVFFHSKIHFVAWIYRVFSRDGRVIDLRCRHMLLAQIII